MKKETCPGQKWHQTLRQDPHFSADPLSPPSPHLVLKSHSQGHSELLLGGTLSPYSSLSEGWSGLHMAAAEITNSKEKDVVFKLSWFYSYNKSMSMKLPFTPQDTTSHSAATLPTRCWPTTSSAPQEPPRLALLLPETAGRLTSPHTLRKSSNDRAVGKWSWARYSKQTKLVQTLRWSDPTCRSAALRGTAQFVGAL